MLKVYACIAHQHDWKLVLLAGGICLLSCAMALGLLGRMSHLGGLRRGAALLVAATVTGIGIWATHFVAMLAFKSGIPTAYEPGGTSYRYLQRSISWA